VLSVGNIKKLAPCRPVFLLELSAGTKKPAQIAGFSGASNSFGTA
jgi:hypothetical protein